MKSKQQAIELAYGEYWEQVKNNLTESNWFKANEVFGGFANTMIYSKMPNIKWECMNNHHPIYCYYFRPKSLQNIETNNNWISILSEKDLPSEDNKIGYLVIDSVGQIEFTNLRHLINRITEGYPYTHYQPITKPEPPIF